MTNPDFARTLSLLRQEKGISQRQAAKALGISQALLSHYENGAREPGLVFVVNACNFYNVSADFMLGRTLSRDGTTILDADTLYDVSDERDNVLKGSVMATLSKKLLVNSLGVLFDLLGQVGNKGAIRAASNYFGTCIYSLFRHLYDANPNNCQDFFSIPKRKFLGGLPRVELTYCEVEFMDAILNREKDQIVPEISNQTLAADYPKTYQSLLQTIHQTSDRMEKQLAARSLQLGQER